MMGAIWQKQRCQVCFWQAMCHCQPCSIAHPPQSMLLKLARAVRQRSTAQYNVILSRTRSTTSTKSMLVQCTSTQSGATLEVRHDAIAHLGLVAGTKCCQPGPPSQYRLVPSREVSAAWQPCTEEPTQSSIGEPNLPGIVQMALCSSRCLVPSAQIFSAALENAS